MPRILEGPAVSAVLALVAALLFAGFAYAFDHPLLTEYAFTPTDGEFLELFNPTGSIIPLDDYFVSDMVYQPDSSDNNACYWHITDGLLAANDFDFTVKFPPGAAIAPGETIVISINDAGGFAGTWGAAADFELPKAGNGGSVPQMVDAGLAHLGSSRVGVEAGLSNGSEIVVLFRWDGESELVEDVDMVQWGSGPVSSTIGPDKTNVTGAEGTAYQPDTPKRNQQTVSPHAFRDTSSRIDFREGSEVRVGGNGITGHDETSENYPDTWLFSGLPSIGGLGPYGPPSILGAGALAENELAVFFSRELEEVPATNLLSYRLLRTLTPSGLPVQTRIQLLAVTAADGGATIVFETGRLEAGALHELTVLEPIPSEDGLGSVIPGSRIAFYGFEAGPELVLEVPRRPFVPHLDGEIRISYSAPQGSTVYLRVFDFQGRKLLERSDRAPLGGRQFFRWDGRDRLNQRLPAGVYYMQMQAGDRQVSKPIVIGAAAEETGR